jgi:hypothetical protein
MNDILTLNILNHISSGKIGFNAGFETNKKPRNGYNE